MKLHVAFIVGLMHFSVSLADVRWLSLATLSSSNGLMPAIRHQSSPPTIQLQTRLNDEDRAVCEQFPGFSNKQRRLCQNHVDNIYAVRQGALLAITECQYQFERRRWNCTIVDQVNVFGRVVATGTREAAFVHAISSAGVVHAVTKSCSSGELDQCGCDRTFKDKPKVESRRLVRNEKGLGSGASKFHWAGCSDNIEYGVAFARTFIDSSETSNRVNKTDRKLVNCHNNNAGRKAVSENVRVRCKCHGVSGSCELRTCWRTVPSMRHVGDILLKKYDTAIQVSSIKSQDSVLRLEPSAGFTSSHRGSPSVSPPVSHSHRGSLTVSPLVSHSQLVFIEASPDFCDADERTGTMGTSGRKCNSGISRVSSSGDLSATDGCDVMCCGRGFKARRRTVVEKCKCRFQWCCTVRCERCKETLVENLCR